MVIGQPVVALFPESYFGYDIEPSPLAFLRCFQIGQAIGQPSVAQLKRVLDILGKTGSST